MDKVQDGRNKESDRPEYDVDAAADGHDHYALRKFGERRGTELASR